MNGSSVECAKHVLFEFNQPFSWLFRYFLLIEICLHIERNKAWKCVTVFPDEVENVKQLKGRLTTMHGMAWNGLSFDFYYVELFNFDEAPG